MRAITTQRIAELKSVAKHHGGILQAADVVEFARNPKTALHSIFEWNDGKAAELYRMEQARQLLRVTVELISVRNEDMSVRVFFSPGGNRKGDDNGGYQVTARLLESKEGRAAILETAIGELEAFKEKYSFLSELCDVFAAIKRARRKR